MKKILFASTALVAFAGAASAEIRMTGTAEMGVSGGDGIETLFHQGVDIRFHLTGESDSGLSFGATFDFEDALERAEAHAHDMNDVRGQNPDFSVFISGAFGTLTLGDIDGAVDWAITDAHNIANPGTIWNDETTHAGAFTAYGDSQHNGQILRYDYSFGDFGVAVSAEMDEAGVLDPALALGLRYALDLGGTTVNLGAGYHTVELVAGVDQEIVAVSASAGFGGGFSAGIAYADIQNRNGGPTDDSHLGIGVGYASGPIALHVNYGEWDSGNKGWGLAAAYDLGGGLSINAGYGADDVATGVDTDTWSLGLKMAF